MISNPASKRKNQSSARFSVELQTSTEDERPVYICGNFNNWNPGDPDYLMKKTGRGRYYLEFPKNKRLPSPIKYKYVRGDWSNVELDKNGNSTNNRVLNDPTGHIVNSVARWQEDGLSYLNDHLPNIRVISENFEIPQLIKTRRIAALLPHDYDNSDQHYPVLYLQDGQNLFDDYAPYGSWGVDKQLALLSGKGIGNIIIIAIDHAKEERIEEFTPSYNTRLGRGDGKKYVRFLADTLKPFIDRHFRTKPERAHTGIGGSSMGGLISIYAGMMYPEVYSKLMIFSPALWVAPNIRFNFMQLHEFLDTRIYLYAGGAESENMIPNVKRFKEEVEKSKKEANLEFQFSIDPEGHHNEARWGEEFPKAVEWLFFDENLQRSKK